MYTHTNSRFNRVFNDSDLQFNKTNLETSASLNKSLHIHNLKLNLIEENKQTIHIRYVKSISNK